LAQERGQGTVEYVGLILLLAAVMAVMVGMGTSTDIPKTIVGKIQDAITSVDVRKKG
jgi:hypothetical protein